MIAFFSLHARRLPMPKRHGDRSRLGLSRLARAIAVRKVSTQSADSLPILAFVQASMRPSPAKTSEHSVATSRAQAFTTRKSRTILSWVRAAPPTRRKAGERASVAVVRCPRSIKASRCCPHRAEHLSAGDSESRERHFRSRVFRAGPAFAPAHHRRGRVRSGCPPGSKSGYRRCRQWRRRCHRPGSGPGVMIPTYGLRFLLQAN